MQQERDRHRLPARQIYEMQQLKNSRAFFPIATWLVRQHVNADKCVGCGICAKVCPCKNITIEDKKARVGENCTQCLSCVHFCPQQALEVRHKAMPKAHQYHHPDIRLKDMMGVGKPWKCSPRS